MFKIIFLLIGTFVGAGFASGREIFNFFTIYGLSGIISIFIFSFLLFFLTLKCLNTKEKLNINNYGEFIVYIEKKYSFFNYQVFICIINIFLAASFYIMSSSLASLFSYQFNISKIITVLITIIVCFYILSKNNLNFICKINSILIPILISFIFLFSINNINFNNIEFMNNNNIFISIFMGILYFSYNSLLLIPVIFNLHNTKNYNNSKIAFLFSFFIFILLLLLNYLLLTFYNEILNVDLPIVYLCNSKIKIFGFFIILSAILTTLISSGYSFINNLNEKNKKIKLISFLLISFLFSFFSLSNLINFFYPLFGFLGLFQIFLILNYKY